MVRVCGDELLDRAPRLGDTTDRARSRARRSSPARDGSSRRPWPARKRARRPRPAARRRPARRSRRRSRPRRSGARPSLCHRLESIDGRCSTSSTPWKIQSSRRAWRSWSPYSTGHIPFQRSCRKCSSDSSACSAREPVEPVQDPGRRGRCRTRPGRAPSRAAAAGGCRRGWSWRGARSPARACSRGTSSHSQISCSSARCASLRLNRSPRW